MSQDQTLGGGSGPTSGDPSPFVKAPAPITPHVETVLDLDEVMSQARRVERTAHICLRSDLTAELEDLVEQLGNLVDADGNVVATGDQALSDAGDAAALNERIQAVQAEMAKSMRTIRFRAMADDAWQPFDKRHRDTNGDIRDTELYYNELIAACAIAPTMTVDQVKALRGSLGPTQIIEMGNAAYIACSTGGVDVPKLPFSSPAPRRSPSGRS